MTYTISHMVHRQQRDEPSRTRSITLSVDTVDGYAPHVSVSASNIGFSSTTFFKTVEQFQEYVNECRVALDAWMIEEMESNDD